MNLTHLGWNSYFSRAFEPYGRRGCQAGRVVTAHRGAYRVLTASGETDAPAAGRLYANGDVPLVGDWVALRPGGAIEAVLPRRTVLERKQPGSVFGRQQLAANLDVLLIVTGLDGDFSTRRIERYLVLVEHSGIEPLVVLSKADLLAEPERRRGLEAVRGLAPETPAMLWSAFDPSGIEVLNQAIGLGRTAALIGSSGAGKTTIVNCLLGCEALSTQAVRESDSRGRHTTTRRQLIALPQGWVLIDMPGLREVQLWAEESAVENVFSEIGGLAPTCRFRNCTHTAEPGCAVQSAAADGRLEPARLAQFHQLRREAAYVEAQQNSIARLAHKRQQKALRRAARRIGRVEGES